jgi:hypothetical protein
MIGSKSWIQVTTAPPQRHQTIQPAALPRQKLAAE